jgi:hypothetical protein
VERLAHNESTGLDSKERVHVMSQGTMTIGSATGITASEGTRGWRKLGLIVASGLVGATIALSASATFGAYQASVAADQARSSQAALVDFLRSERDEAPLPYGLGRSVVVHNVSERAENGTPTISLDAVPAFLRSERQEAPYGGR